jgi:lipopolysaccharide transport system permease protein
MMSLINNELKRKKDLLWLLTKKEITLKYKRTSLGILWSLMNPVLFSLVLFVSFKIFMRFKTENFFFFLFSGLFAWNWFSASVTLSAGTLTGGNTFLIKKVSFPRHFLIIAMILAQFANFILALPLIAGLSWVQGKGPGMNWLIAIPILSAIQFIVTSGICLTVSVVNAYFRDMEYIVGVGISLLFWMTPIIYPMEMVPESIRHYLVLNPLTHLITSWRALLMSNDIKWGSIGIAFGSALICLLFGVIVFRKLGKTLDEVI